MEKKRGFFWSEILIWLLLIFAAKGWLAPGSLQCSLVAIFSPISMGFAPFYGDMWDFLHLI